MKLGASLKLELLDPAANSGRGRWRHIEALPYVSDLIGAQAVPAGAETDLNSTPRLPGLYFVGGAVSPLAAAIHDDLYTRKIVTREQADNVFFEALRATGVSGWRARLMLAGVRVGGASRWNDRAPEQQEGPQP